MGCKLPTRVWGVVREWRAARGRMRILMRGGRSDGGKWRRRLTIEGLRGRSRSLLLSLCWRRSWCMVGRGGDR